MPAMTEGQVRQLRLTLEEAAVKCSERCLYQSAKWAAELATSLSKQLGEDSETDNDSQMAGGQEAPSSIVRSYSTDPEEARLESLETHKYLLAKAYFDCREFDRCAAVFLPSALPEGALATTPTKAKIASPSPVSKGKARQSETSFSSNSDSKLPNINGRPLSQKALFLSLYAKYMAGEKKKEEASENILGPSDKGSVVNLELVGISKILEDFFTHRDPEKSSSGWLEYLYGIVLAKSKNEEAAKTMFIRSVSLYPWHWGAWQELSDLINNLEELQQIIPDLPREIMSFFFNLHTNQTLFQTSDPVFRQLSDLESLFPESQFIKTERALLLYHAKDYEESELIFSSILHSDPYRIDALDHYSNILYVMSNRPKLAFLAQLATKIDKFRPETCCVVGNYYALKSEHEKAVQYFRRALLLDRTFLSAWTLLGHEYVEMKNTHAAIESYRRAVDANRKDYRAWYGLGQTYEMLEMYLYALFYYQRAASLRPLDAQMWTAVASCYDRIGRPQQSIKAYKRALVAGTYYDATSSFSGSVGGANNAAATATGAVSVGGAPDPHNVTETLYNIALVYEKLGHGAETAEYMELVLAQEEGLVGEEGDEDGEGSAGEDGGGGGGGGGIGVTNTTSKARMWLARWEFGRGELKRAMELGNELCQDGVEVEEAKALVRDVRARMENAEA